MLDIVEFTEEHLDPAAELLAERHARHRLAEPLLPADVDFRAQIESEWRVEGASGVFASSGGDAVGYLFGRPQAFGWFTVGIGGHALRGDAEQARDLYAAAAATWVDAGHTVHAVYLPVSETALVDAWFRLSFGASAALAMRETAREDPFEAGVTIRPGTPDDLEVSARLDRELTRSMVPSPSFSSVRVQTDEEYLEDWRDTWDDSQEYVHFVAERDGVVVGHTLLYKRPADLRVPADSIDLANVATFPEARGGGVARALFAHVLGWAHENGYPTMVTDWRMTNLLASRFWPRRGFRLTFLRLYRSIP